MKLHAFLITILMAGVANANDLRGVLRNNSGVRKLNGKDAPHAIDDFTGALGDLPYAGEVHYNIGNSFLVRREYEKALSEYQQAQKHAAGDSQRARETRFRALFNSGVALTELKKIDEALAAYQQALSLDPESIEAKTNIEALTAQGNGEGEGKDKDDQDGKGKNNDKDKDDKGDKDKEKKNQPQKFDNPKPTPRQFKSEELSQQDVKRILEELKRQEEQIRARMQNEQRKDAPPDKDW